jgi:hypothetical protein
VHPTSPQQRELCDWLVAHEEGLLTGDSFFHLPAYGEALPGLNCCDAGRVVDPAGNGYAGPFAIHDNFLASNVRGDGGFTAVWRESELFADLRGRQTEGACQSCSAFISSGAAPNPSPDHSHRRWGGRAVPVQLGLRPPAAVPPCDENPLAGFRPGS